MSEQDAIDMLRSTLDKLARERNRYMVALQDIVNGSVKFIGEPLNAQECVSIAKRALREGADITR